MDTQQQDQLRTRLHREIRRLASAINASPDWLPQDVAAPDSTWISLYWREAADGDDEDGWYVALMRNEDGSDWELAEVAADHSDYLLYVLFDEITAKLARSALHPSEQGDQRATWFAAQEELLGRLNSQWRDRTRERHARALSACP